MGGQQQILSRRHALSFWCLCSFSQVLPFSRKDPSGGVANVVDITTQQRKIEDPTSLSCTELSSYSSRLLDSRFFYAQPSRD